MPVLYGIDLKVREGEFLALMGPSGSGKTTLLNLIAGLDRADSGRLVVAGVPISELSRNRPGAVEGPSRRVHIPVL